MALVLPPRVLETSTTTGTGTLTLAGAVAGFQSFAAVGNANTCYYSLWAVDGDGVPTGDWEEGLGTYTASGTTLARTTIFGSSNAGAAVDLAAGTKRVAVVRASQGVGVFILGGGTVGEDETRVYHTGTSGVIESLDGVMSMKRGTGLVAVDNTTVYTEFSGTAKHLLNTTLFSLANDVSLVWNSGAGASSGGNDIALKRIDVSVLGLTDASTGGGSLEFTELTAPAAGAANTARLYAEDNGSGKTRLVAKFADGSTAVVATQP